MSFAEGLVEQAALTILQDLGWRKEYLTSAATDGLERRRVSNPKAGLLWPLEEAARRLCHQEFEFGGEDLDEAHAEMFDTVAIKPATNEISYQAATTLRDLPRKLMPHETRVKNAEAAV